MLKSIQFVHVQSAEASEERSPGAVRSWAAPTTSRA